MVSNVLKQSAKAGQVEEKRSDTTPKKIKLSSGDEQYLKVVFLKKN